MADLPAPKGRGDRESPFNPGKLPEGLVWSVWGFCSYVPFLLLQRAIPKQLSQWGCGGLRLWPHRDWLVSCIVPSGVSRPLASLLAVLRLCFFTLHQAGSCPLCRQGWKIAPYLLIFNLLGPQYDPISFSHPPFSKLVLLFAPPQF